jgi:hypothetical protein
LTASHIHAVGPVVRILLRFSFSSEFLWCRRSTLGGSVAKRNQQILWQAFKRASSSPSGLFGTLGTGTYMNSNPFTGNQGSCIE